MTAMAIWVCFVQSAAAAPRVMSISLCVSQYVLALADREQIVSLPSSAYTPRLSFLHERAVGIPANRRSAEEVIISKPDVVFAGFIDRETISLIERLGTKVIRFKPAYNIADVKEQIMIAAEALEQVPRGRDLIARIDSAETRARAAIASSRMNALVYRGNGYAFAGDTLVDSIMDASGLDNLAADLGFRRGTHVPLETVVMSSPDVLIDDWTQAEKTRVAEDFLDHPALRRGWPKQTRIDFPIVYWLCGGESLPAGIDRLTAAVDDAAQPKDLQP